MGVCTFMKYVFYLVNTFIDVTNSNDLILSLGLYVIYPAILFLLIDKFHGVCGAEAYYKKADAVEACNSVFLLFTALLRTSKLILIILYTVDANSKSGSQRSLIDPDDPDYLSESSSHRRRSSGVGIMGKLKCQSWVHLSQELISVGLVSFLLIICLPVLAFWFMLISILFSLCSLYSLSKRVWKDSHDSMINLDRRGDGYRDDEEDDDEEDDDYDDDDLEEEGGGGDIEFQQFLSNFGEEASE